MSLLALLLFASLPIGCAANWSEWSATCSGGLCGSGTSNRTCNASDPSCNNSTTSITVSQMCPVCGVWSGWTNVTACAGTCGTGTWTLVRQCNWAWPSTDSIIGCRPACTIAQVAAAATSDPTCGTLQSESASCNLTGCPVAGNWSEWSAWGSCVPGASCGVGLQSSTRTCTNPAPANGGANCTGSATQYQACNTSTACGSLLYYDSYPCSATCGAGTAVDVYLCNGTDPADPVSFAPCWPNCSNASLLGTPACGFVFMNTSVCNNVSCSTTTTTITTPAPVNGNWTAWSAWTTCVANNLHCGNGTYSHNRTCSDPAPAYGGADCNGTAYEVATCDTGIPCGSWQLKFSYLCACVTNGSAAVEAYYFCEDAVNGQPGSFWPCWPTCAAALLGTPTCGYGPKVVNTPCNMTGC